MEYGRPAAGSQAQFVARSGANLWDLGSIPGRAKVGHILFASLPRSLAVLISISSAEIQDVKPPTHSPTPSYTYVHLFSFFWPFSYGFNFYNVSNFGASFSQCHSVRCFCFIMSIGLVLRFRYVKKVSYFTLVLYTC